MSSNPDYRAAISELRAFTKSAADRPTVSVLVRAAVISRPAARAVLANPLRTRSDRKKAVLDAVAAIAAAEAAKAEK